MGSIYIGIDPSFKRTGISVYKEGSIYISDCRLESNPDKSFEQVFKDARCQSSNILGTIDKMVDVGDNDVVAY